MISPGGSELGEIRVLDVATGRDTGDRIEAARGQAGSWMPDSRSFTYWYFQRLAADAPRTETFQKLRIHLHTLGTPPEKDEPVFGYGVNPNVPLEPAVIPWVYVPLGSKYAVAMVNSGVAPNSEFHIAPLATLDQTPIPWRKVVRLEDEVSAIDIRGDDMYLLTYNKAPRHKIIHMNAARPDISSARVVFAASEAVVLRWRGMHCTCKHSTEGRDVCTASSTQAARRRRSD